MWPFEKRSNGTIRPTYVDKPNDAKKSVSFMIMIDRLVLILKTLVFVQIFQHADMKPKWSVFVETLSPGN